MLTDTNFLKKIYILVLEDINHILEASNYEVFDDALNKCWTTIYRIFENIYEVLYNGFIEKWRNFSSVNFLIIIQVSQKFNSFLLAANYFLSLRRTFVIEQAIDPNIARLIGIMLDRVLQFIYVLLGVLELIIEEADHREDLAFSILANLAYL